MTDMNGIPQGFGSALSKSEKAMETFALLNESEKKRIIDLSRSVRSKKEMNRLVSTVLKIKFLENGAGKSVFLFFGKIIRKNQAYVSEGTKAFAKSVLLKDNGFVVRKAKDFAAVRCFKAKENSKKGGLSTTGRRKEAIGMSFFQGQIQVMEEFFFLIGF